MKFFNFISKPLTILSVIVLTAFSFYAFVMPQSGGAPVSSTGAPGEVNCTTSSCHDDGIANSGDALSFISVNNGATSYEPGKTYPIRVSISDAKSQRFGFQLVALSSSQVNAGSLQISDEERTQIITNPNELTDRLYATYTYQGTSPVRNGEGEWTINWTAPEKDMGPITFYAAMVSANNDGTDKGDKVYTLSTTLNPAALSDVNECDRSFLTIRPNPTQESIAIPIPEAARTASVISIVNMNGVQIDKFACKTGGTMIYNVSSLAKGQYLVQILGCSRVYNYHFTKE